MCSRSWTRALPRMARARRREMRRRAAVSARVKPCSSRDLRSGCAPFHHGPDLDSERRNHPCYALACVNRAAPINAAATCGVRIGSGKLGNRRFLRMFREQTENPGCTPSEDHDNTQVKFHNRRSTQRESHEKAVMLTRARVV